MTAAQTSRSVAWAGLEIASLLLLSFATLIVLARLLGPAEFGLAALALAIVHFLTIMTRALFIDAIVQRERIEAGHLDAAFWAGLTATGLLVGLCALAAPWLGRLFGEPQLPAVFLWTAVSLAFTGADGVPVALLRRNLMMKQLAIRSALARLAGAAVGIGMALGGYGVWSLVGQQLAMEAGNALAAYWMAGWRPTGRRPSPRHLRELTRFALPWLGGELLLAGNHRLFGVLVGYLFGTTALGYVNLAFRTVGMLGMVLELAAHQVSMPIFARLQDNLPGLRGTFYKATAIASFLVLPFFTGTVVCAEPMVLALLGPDWQPAVPLIQLIAVATFLHFLLCLTSTVYSAVGRPIWRLWRGEVDLAVTTAGLVALAGLGPIAAGLVWAGRFLVLIPFSWYGMRRLIRLEAVSQARVLAPSVAATGLMAVVLLVARLHLPAAWTAGQELALLVPLGALTYLIAFSAIAREDLREYLDHARSALTPSRQQPSGSAEA